VAPPDGAELPSGSRFLSGSQPAARPAVASAGGTDRLADFLAALRQWPSTEADARRILAPLRVLLGCDALLLRASLTEALALEVLEPRAANAEVGDRVFAEVGSRFDSSASIQKIALPEGLPVREVQLVPLANSRVRGWLAAGFAQRAPVAEERRLALVSVAIRLELLAERSEQATELRRRSEFLSVASHELKTPLTAMQGLLQLQQRLLRAQGAGGGPAGLSIERQQEFLKVVLRQCGKLNELIDGLLDVSRIENGRFPVDPAQTDVVAIVRETVAQRLAPVAGDAGVTLQLELPDAFPGWVDPVRFEEVVTNLGMNAIRFSPEGGTVRLRLRGRVDQGFTLTFRDQGPPVSELDRERIFQPFEKAQRTGRLGGLGLGLFISRQIAQLHGGNVVLSESVPGRGNLFTADFPGKGPARASGAG
jgi:signal transduction histidine kinase